MPQIRQKTKCTARFWRCSWNRIWLLKYIFVYDFYVHKLEQSKPYQTNCWTPKMEWLPDCFGLETLLECFSIKILKWHKRMSCRAIQDNFSNKHQIMDVRMVIKKCIHLKYWNKTHHGRSHLRKLVGQAARPSSNCIFVSFLSHPICGSDAYFSTPNYPAHVLETKKGRLSCQKMEQNSNKKRRN